MRGKNKSFVEDTIILLVIGVIIYGIYTFFFASTQEVEIQSEPIAVERKASSDIQVDKESVNKQSVPVEKINEDDSTRDAPKKVANLEPHGEQYKL